MVFGKREGVPKWQFDTKFTDEEEYAQTMARKPQLTDESLLFPDEDEN